MKSEKVILYVVQPFLRGVDDSVVKGEAYEVPSAFAAKSKASNLTGKTIGAIAFSRTGDIQAGEWDDAVILGVYGEIPDGAFDD